MLQMPLGNCINSSAGWLIGKANVACPALVHCCCVLLLMQTYQRAKAMRGLYDKPDLVHSLYQRVGGMVQLTILSCPSMTCTRAARAAVCCGYCLHSTRLHMYRLKCTGFMPDVLRIAWPKDS